MSRPVFASGKRAWGLCDICGFKYRLKMLKDQYERRTNTHLKACTSCWSEDHPQLRLGEVAVFDPQAIRDPRPDNREYGSMRANIVPILPHSAKIFGVGKVGTTTVATP